MTGDLRRRRLEILGASLLALLGLLALASGAQAQERVEGDVLQNTSSLIGFTGAEDTVVEEVGERPAQTRATRERVALRGQNTVSDPGEDEARRDYLLALSASGAFGIDEEVLERYEHGDLEQAVLYLDYRGGCNSPNGQLSVHAIANRSWDPFAVSWTDTTRSGEGSLETNGPRLAQVPLSAEAVQAQDNVNCGAAQIPLDVDHVDDIFTGELGGLALFWQGQNELNVSTLDAASPPRLEVEFSTNGPAVNSVHAEGGFPLVTATGQRVALQVNASDPQGLEADAVEIRLSPNQAPDRDPIVLEATRSGSLFVATHTFAHDQEGPYDVRARTTDGDGWTAEGTPNASSPHVLADADPPEIPQVTLAGNNSTEPVSADQHGSIPLRANVEDLSCRSAHDACVRWKLTWRGLTLASGTLEGDQDIEADVGLPRPGNTTARLTLRDAAGHENASLTWPLEVVDTVPPDARPLESTDLAPGRSTTLEEGTPLTVAFEMIDDPPVDANLSLEGATSIEKELPGPDEEGKVKASFEDVPEGDYRARLVLDDGTHERTIDFGRLTIAPPGAPSVSFQLSSSHIGPSQAIQASVRDRNVDADGIDVSATIDGLEVHPDAETTQVSGGLDVLVRLDELSHGDDVTVTVKARDARGLTSTGQVQLQVDAQPPELASPPAIEWKAPDESIDFEAEDDGPGDALITVEAGTRRTTGSSPLSIPVDRLVSEPGRLRNVTVSLEDASGNEAVRHVEVGTDAQPPEAEATFTRDGLVIVARDEASGVLRVDAATSLNDPEAELEETPVFRDSPEGFFVAAGSLSGGDEIRLAAQVRDEVGHIAYLGSRADPLELTVPDRPPAVSLQREGPSVGTTGIVNWTVGDPDEEPLEVELQIQAPSGSVETLPVDAIGSREIEATETGRHTVRLTASSAGNTTSEETFFYLSPQGTLLQVGSVAERVDPGSELVIELSFPTEPREVFVTATDEANATTSASVELSGDRARATFAELPEGNYDIEAMVVYEEGAVERQHVASVQSQESIGDRLAGLLVPLLVLLAIGLVVAIAYVWYRRREEEKAQEAEAEGAEGGPA